MTEQEELQDFLNDDGNALIEVRAAVRSSIADYLHKKTGRVDVMKVEELLDLVGWTFKVDQV
jgi:hypothetical protein